MVVDGVQATFLSVDDVALYWTEGPGHALSLLSKAMPVSIQSLGDGYESAVSDHVVYSVTPDSSLAGDLGMTSVVRYYPGLTHALGTFAGRGNLIATDGATIFVETLVDLSGASKIWAQPIDGSAATLLAEDTGAEDNGIAVSNGEVFWVSLHFSAGGIASGAAIKKVPVTGGTPVTLASFPWVSEFPLGFAVDSASVYVSVPNETAAVPCKFETLWRIDRQTSTTTSLVEGGKMHSIALDANDVYWADQCAGTVSRMPLGGGPISVITNVPATPEAATEVLGVALDDSDVYWTIWGTSNQNGSIRRLPKPAQ